MSPGSPSIPNSRPAARSYATDTTDRASSSSTSSTAHRGASGLTKPARALVESCDHLHVMGTSLFSATVVETILMATGIVKAKGGTVSFDPNVRPEMLGLPGLREAFESIFAHCDLFLPSGRELYLFTKATADEAGAIEEILRLGVKAVVVKNGDEGATYHDRETTVRQPAFRVKQIDPTGAGDCFGATFVELLAARHAGARSASLRGGRGRQGGRTAGADGRRLDASGARRLRRRAGAECMTIRHIADIARDRRAGAPVGIASVCTAHPVVIEAALLRAVDGRTGLIEATCNQVNQQGGYTGMTPADFRRFVEAIADTDRLRARRLILGGDHLGPNPWKHLPARRGDGRGGGHGRGLREAGFTKLASRRQHGLRRRTHSPAGRRHRPPRRAARARGRSLGGWPPAVLRHRHRSARAGRRARSIERVDVTSPEAALHTVEVHRAAFATAGAEKAFDRALAVVVQPGVEYGNANVIRYRREQARELSAVLSRMPQFVFEAHSTDYQSLEALRALVEDGFAILKVGPWLTFALREALYGLDQIAAVLDPAFSEGGLMTSLERLMTREPGNWKKYYHGDPAEQRIQRHFSYSDRIRYYWPHAEAARAVERLLSFFERRTIPGDSGQPVSRRVLSRRRRG